MGTIKIDGFKLVIYKGDHSPRHVHIFYRGRQLGRFDIENRRSMDRKLVLDGRLKKAIKKAGYL